MEPSRQIPPPPSIECPTQALYDAACKKKRLISSDSTITLIRENSLKPNPLSRSNSYAFPKPKNVAYKGSARPQFPDGNYEWTSITLNKTFIGKWSEGEFVSGVAIDGNSEATGSFHNFQLHGGGIINIKDCPKYHEAGNYVFGKLEGEGFRRVPAGKVDLVEKGTFSQGHLHGIGIRAHVTQEGGYSLFEKGEFKNGKLHGQGSRIENNLRFTGLFADGEFIEN